MSVKIFDHSLFMVSHPFLPHKGIKIEQFNANMLGSNKKDTKISPDVLDIPYIEGWGSELRIVFKV